MLVWAGGESGTIGGGALEWQAAAAARAQLRDGPQARVARVALGPKLGQCCGGAVTLLTEIFDAQILSAPPFDGSDPVIRPLPGATAATPPLALQRLRAIARNGSGEIRTGIHSGWMLEPLAKAQRELWIWGAGHVGRALVEVLRPLPDFALTWIDTSRARFPEALPEGVAALWDPRPTRLLDYSPASSEHLIFTYSHALDLEICHRLLLRSTFRSAGLIGSETKRARFRSRLVALGHPASEIARIQCPIGDPRLGKAPQAIAIGVAAEMLGRYHHAETEIADDDRDCRAVARRGRDQSLSGGGR